MSESMILYTRCMCVDEPDNNCIICSNKRYLVSGLSTDQAATIAKLREELAQKDEYIDRLCNDYEKNETTLREELHKANERIEELEELLSRSKKSYEANVMCTNVECKNIALQNRSICATCCDWWEMVQERDDTIKDQQKQIERLERENSQ
jgi:chromosome segregation ATPase